MAKRDRVDLANEERKQFLAVLKKGKVAARTGRRAQILLQADAGERDEAMAATVQVGVATVERIRKRFVTEGLDAALTERRPAPAGSQNSGGKKKPF